MRDVLRAGDRLEQAGDAVIPPSRGALVGLDDIADLVARRASPGSARHGTLRHERHSRQRVCAQPLPRGPADRFRRARPAAAICAGRLEPPQDREAVELFPTRLSHQAEQLTARTSKLSPLTATRRPCAGRYDTREILDRQEGRLKHGPPHSRSRGWRTGRWWCSPEQPKEQAEQDHGVVCPPPPHARDSAPPAPASCKHQAKRRLRPAIPRTEGRPPPRC